VLRPEEALSIARQEVVRLRRARLVGRAAHIDDATDFVMLAWDVFGAREFPFDTARLLALAVGGLDLEELERAKVLVKKSGAVRLLEPRERVRRMGDDAPGVHPTASTFGSMIDAVHTVLHVADVDGMHAAKALMDRAGLTEDEGFLATVQGLVNAIPRAKHKGQWINPEAGLLDTLVTAYLPSIEVPVEKDVQDLAQASLFDTE
jgi:putative DNA methylase